MSKLASFCEDDESSVAGFDSCGTLNHAEGIRRNPSSLIVRPVWGEPSPLPPVAEPLPGHDVLKVEDCSDAWDIQRNPVDPQSLTAENRKSKKKNILKSQKNG